MARQFDIPDFYTSPIISRVKQARQQQDPRKQDLSPSLLDFGSVRFILARHFGFCFGVENAVEIAYQTLAAHPERRIFFLSEMIHNPDVNQDLQDRGVRFPVLLFGPPADCLGRADPERYRGRSGFRHHARNPGQPGRPGARSLHLQHPPVRSSNGCGSAAASSAPNTTRWSCTAKPATRKPGRPFPTVCRMRRPWWSST